MEIERKYLLKQLPSNLDSYASKKIAQGYLCTSPVVRVRRSNDSYYMTYKGAGLMVREEYSIFLSQKKPTTILSKRLMVVSSKRHAISYLLTVV